MPEPLVLSVKGMTCTNCAQGIARHLEKKGLHNVLVSYENGTVEVPAHDGWSPSAVADEINTLGYKAVMDDGHSHEVKSKMTVTEIYFLVSAVLTFPLLLHMFSGLHLLHQPWFQFMLATPVIIIGCIYFGRSALGSLKTGSPNMDVLIATGSLSAYFYSVVLWMMATSGSVHSLYFETGATIVTLVLLGNIIEHRSLKRTRSAMEDLTRLQPQSALLIHEALTANEHTAEVDASKLKLNDLVLIPEGSRVPADGSIYFGSGVIDESAMTGESIPVSKNENDQVLAGTVLMDGTIKIIVSKSGTETVLSRMIEMVRTATLRKPVIQKFGDRVSARFVPVVLMLSVITFLLHYFIGHHTVALSLMSAVAVLVISCPCAMGLATPTAVAVGVGRAAKLGILIKGGDVLERLTMADTFVFDKTGTLTKGRLRIKHIEYYSDKHLAEFLLGRLEQHSTHPAAKPIADAFQQVAALNDIRFKRISEIKGVGVECEDAEGNIYRAGSFRVASAITSDDTHQVYLVKNNELLATVDLEDEVRESAVEVFKYLKSQGKKLIILSGDSHVRVAELASSLGADEYYAGQMPDEKSAVIRELQKHSKVAMVGDGINDAPSLAEAFVSISPGSGTQIAMKSSDMILMGQDPLSQIKTSLAVADHTLKTIRQNLFWALIYNVIAIPVAAFGLLSPIIASLSMAFSDVVVIGNSVRLRFKRIFEAGDSTA